MDLFQTLFLIKHELTYVKFINTTIIKIKLRKLTDKNNKYLYY